MPGGVRGGGREAPLYSISQIFNTQRYPQQTRSKFKKTLWVIPGNKPYRDRISPYQNEPLAYGQIL